VTTDKVRGKRHKWTEAKKGQIIANAEGGNKNSGRKMKEKKKGK